MHRHDAFVCGIDRRGAAVRASLRARSLARAVLALESRAQLASRRRREAERSAGCSRHRLDGVDAHMYNIQQMCAAGQRRSHTRARKPAA